MSETPLETLLEAQLFSAGKTVSPKEIAESLGYDEAEVAEGLEVLQASMKRRRNSALQLVNIGGKWAMEVKPAIAEHLPKETKTDLPPRLMKAAALFAYHQPMPQSRLVDMLGQRAYDHVRDLAQSGMIERRRDGNTRRLSTTRRFSEVFGCPHTERKKVKAWFRDMLKDSGILDDLAGALILEEEGEAEGTVQSQLTLEEPSSDVPEGDSESE